MEPLRRNWVNEGRTFMTRISNRCKRRLLSLLCQGYSKNMMSTVQEEGSQQTLSVLALDLRLYISQTFE